MTKQGMTPEQAAQLSLAEQHEWFRRATSRRAMLRGGLVGAGAAIAGTAIASAAGVTGTASAAPVTSAASLLPTADRRNGSTVVPFGRHISYGADPTRQMSVAWQATAAVRNPFVRIGHSPQDLGEKLHAEVRALSTLASDTSPIDSVALVSPSTIEQYYLHAALDGLRPGETYYYAVGHDGWDPRSHLAVVNSFTTAPSKRGPFTFTAFGDQGISYDAVATTHLITGQRPAFHLHAGDVSYAEGTGHGLITDSYDPKVWDSFFQQVEAVAATVPWQVASGNHEMEPWYSADGNGGLAARFDFAGQQNTYYSFSYGNVGVITLDANDLSYEIPANNGYTGGKQTAWLEQELASLRKRADIDFIVVQFHHCAYSTCSSHASEGGVRQYWVPLFDSYGVDLVINGHNHVYERTDPLKGGSVTTPAPSGSTVTPATQGTTYVVAGGAGNSLYSFPAKDSYDGAVDDVSPIASFVNEPGKTKTPETVAWSRVRYTGYCLLAVDSAPARRGSTSKLTVRAINGFGAEIDRVVLARTAK
jgi:hypothetical protein